MKKPYVVAHILSSIDGRIQIHNWRPLNTSDILFGKILHYNYSSVRDWPGQAKKSIRRNDILFGKITPCPENGKVALVKELPADYGIGSTEFITLSPRPGTSRETGNKLIWFDTWRGCSAWRRKTDYGSYAGRIGGACARIHGVRAGRGRGLPPIV